MSLLEVDLEFGQVDTDDAVSNEISIIIPHLQALRKRLKIKGGAKNCTRMGTTTNC